MVTTLLAILFRPLTALFFLGLIVLPITLALARVIPDGTMKQVLYKKRTAWWDMPLLRKRSPAPDRSPGRTFEQ